MRVLLDFDGTLCPDPCDRSPETPPPAAAIALVRRLKEAGHEIVILSCRANESAPDGYRARHAKREIRDYLKAHGVPFDDILTSKPHADAIIDERALPFDGDWKRLSGLLRWGLLLRGAPGRARVEH